MTYYGLASGVRPQIALFRIFSHTGSDPISDNITYETLAAPTVTAVSPNFGPTLGDTSVTVSGTNFFRADGTTSAITALNLDGNVALSRITAAPSGTNAAGSFTFSTNSHIAGGPYAIIVTTPGGSSSSSVSIANGFEYKNVPAVTAIKWTAGGGLDATYVKAGDIVFIYADFICGTGTALNAGVDAVHIGGTPVTSRQAVVCSGTSGYVEVVLPAKTQSMTTQYSVQLTSDAGAGATVSPVKLIYPLTPELDAMDNNSYGNAVAPNTATPSISLIGNNFWLTDSGPNLVRTVRIFAADGITLKTDVTVFTADSKTSFAGVTIPAISPSGVYTIIVETYGGFTDPFAFDVLAAATLTYPTTNAKTYMWTTPNTVVKPNQTGLEPFTILGTGFGAASVVTFENADYVTPTFNNVAPKIAPLPARLILQVAALG